MSKYLCITIRFLQPYCHARAEQGQPEWPPSPLRLFQALTAAAAGHWNERVELRTANTALKWLENQTIAKIIAPAGTPSNTKHRLYVPDNVGDKVAGSWSRGGTASIADHRTEKDVLPIQLQDDAVYFLWPLGGDDCPHLDIIRSAARSTTHLGWGIDVVAGNAEVISNVEAAELQGEVWTTSNSKSGVPLRLTTAGTLDDVMRKHREFLNRLGPDSRDNDSFRPVGPLKAFDVARFRRQGDVEQRCTAIFRLGNTDGSPFYYPQRKLIHIAGMVRHLAIAAMQESPPDDDDIVDVEAWIDQYVAGHRQRNAVDHQQLSYLPLPSIGHRHVDGGVRRVMISAPSGDDTLLSHLALRLEGELLRPKNGNEFGNQSPPVLSRVNADNVADYYTAAANRWASVTPVILPGHDDHKPAKTRKLILSALAQSGIDQPCTFQWSAFSHFPKSLSAHKYDRKKRRIGYIRPDHLSSQTAVHLTLQFDDELRVPGPLAIGAGRHCGLGLMARIDT